MALKGPTTADVNKLHAEVNQLTYMRFLVTTVAVTLFGVMLTWIVPKNSNPTDFGPFEFVACIVLSFLLFGLFILNYGLRCWTIAISAYLVVFEKSGWEYDLQQYRQHEYFAYTKSFTWVFLGLNLITAAFPFVLSAAFDVSANSGKAAMALAVIGTVTELTMFFMGILGVFQRDQKYEERWRQLKKS